jgi:hypothetical protein
MALVKFVYLIFVTFLFQLTMAGQSSMPNSQDPELLPKVFLIGQHEILCRQMADESTDMLLDVCDNSLQLAFESWTKMLSEMEQMADNLNFDMKGIKVWINIFWEADGQIKHIVYYPKPNSKNIEYEELSAFFTYFINNSTSTLKHDKPFSHYGSASFPSLVKRTASQMIDKN